MAQRQADKQRHDAEYKAAHKAVTLKANKVRKAGKMGTKGSTLKELADEAQADLSPNNPRTFTPGALNNWHFKGKTPGSSPQLAGSAGAGEARAALIASGKSYSRCAQLENKAPKTTELVRKACARPAPSWPAPRTSTCSRPRARKTGWGRSSARAKTR